MSFRHGKLELVAFIADKFIRLMALVTFTTL